MTAVRIIVPETNSQSKVMITYKGKNVLKAYDKKDLLQLLVLYSKWHCPTKSDMLREYLLNVRSTLFRARCEYGTQFILDLFLMTEVYMKHWPIYAFHVTRVHIIYVLNQCPDYRLLYEE